jgi:hypothetical protein
MIYSVPPFTFDFATSLVAVDAGSVDVDCADLYAAAQEAQSSEEGIIYDAIASASGLVELGPGVQVGLTVQLLGEWQLRFPPGNYTARVAGGNLVGGPGGDPIAYTAGVQTLLIQSAASTVVSVSTGSGLSAEQAAQLDTIEDAAAAIEAKTANIVDGKPVATKTDIIVSKYS